jgi:hypothetical protein
MTLTLSVPPTKNSYLPTCQGTQMPFLRRFRRMENQYFLDGGRKKKFRYNRVKNKLPTL